MSNTPTAMSNTIKTMQETTHMPHGTYNDADFVIGTLADADAGTGTGTDSRRPSLAPSTSSLATRDVAAEALPTHISVPLGEGRRASDTDTVNVPETTAAEVLLHPGSRTVRLDSLRFHENNFVAERPTQLLEDRFSKWARVLKQLGAYLKEVAYAQEQFARINNTLRDSCKFDFLTDVDPQSHQVFDPLLSRVVTKLPQSVPLIEKQGNKQHDAMSPLANPNHDQEAVEANGSAFSGFMQFGSGSVQDMQVVLKKHHMALASQQFKVSKELMHSVVPELDSLRKDLASKIKEIRELAGDFKTDIATEVKLTDKLMAKYAQSVKGNYTGGPLADPWLSKVQLDLQVKHQLYEENYLRDAHINLQESALSLEKIVYAKLQQTMQYYSYLIDSESRLALKTLCHELKQGLLAQPPAAEWDHFVTHHPLCMIPWRSFDPRPTDRTTADVAYPHIKSPMARCIRNGYLCKRQAGEKEYTRAFFLVTSGYIHQFASSHFFETRRSIQDSRRDSARDNFVPQWSVSLDDCEVARYSESELVLRTSKVYIQREKQRDAPVAAPQQPKGFAKLFKSSGTTPPPTTAQGSTTRRKSLVAVKSEEPIEVSLRIADTQPTEEDIDTFKKWVYDIKKLASYNSIATRSDYITQKIAKTKRGSVVTAMVQGPDASASVSAPAPAAAAAHLSLGKFALKEVTMDRKRSVDGVDPMEKSESAHPAHISMPLTNALPLPGVPQNALLHSDSAYVTSTTQARNPSSLSKGSNPRYNSGSSQDSHGRTHAVALHAQRRSTFGSLGMMKTRSGSKATEPRVMDKQGSHDDSELTLKLTSSLYSQVS